MTNVPDLVRAAIVAPIGNSDHSSVGSYLYAEAVPNVCVSREVLMKRHNLHKINLNTVCGAIQGLPWRNI